MDAGHPETAISVRKLSCAYGQRLILNEVSFDVHRGEIFVIIGATGCGKTTLLKHMIGLYRPVSGSITYHIKRLGQSRDMAQARGPEQEEILRHLGVMYPGRGPVRVHDPAGKRAIAPGGVHRPAARGPGVHRPHEALPGRAGALRLLHARGALRRHAEARGAIARAMALDPEILFLDEPSAGLDPSTSAGLDELIRGLSQSLGVTFVVVSHELPSIFSIADTVILLEESAKGIVAQGDPRELRNVSDKPRGAAILPPRGRQSGGHMSTPADTFKLGLFILVGSALFVLTVVVLGAGRFFKNVYVMETYINESVNGLEVGSPVKFRGVKVGSVTNIGFVTDKYADFFSSKYRYVLVECALEARYFHNLGLADMERGIRAEVDRGLRVRPVSQGLTGQLYLGIDYVDPDSNPPPAIDWEPRNIYIPSAPSTLSKVEEAVARISDTLGALNKRDLETIIADVKTITASLSQFLKGGDKQGVGKLLAHNLEELGKAIERVNTLLARPEFEALLSHAGHAAAGIDRVVSTAGEDVIATAASLREATQTIRSTSQTLSEFLQSPELKQNMAGLNTTFKNVNASAGDLRLAASRLQSLLSRVNGPAGRAAVEHRGHRGGHQTAGGKPAGTLRRGQTLPLRRALRPAPGQSEA